MVGVDDGLGEFLGCFLGQVLPDAALDHTVRVFTREFLGVGAGVRVRSAVGVALEGDGGHGDGRKGGEPPLRTVVRRIARRAGITKTVGRLGALTGAW